MLITYDIFILRIEPKIQILLDGKFKILFKYHKCENIIFINIYITTLLSQKR